MPEAERHVRITAQFHIWDHIMKYASIFLLSSSLLSGAAFAGSNTEAAVGGALGGA